MLYTVERNCELKLYVIEGEGVNLLGRSWLSVIKLDWNSVFKRAYESNYISGKVTNKVKVLEVLLNKHQAIFTDELGPIKNLKAKLSLKLDARPKFHKARSLPFALRGCRKRNRAYGSCRHTEIRFTFRLGESACYRT